MFRSITTSATLLTLALLAPACGNFDADDFDREGDFAAGDSLENEDGGDEAGGQGNGSDSDGDGCDGSSFDPDCLHRGDDGGDGDDSGDGDGCGGDGDGDGSGDGDGDGEPPRQEESEGCTLTRGYWQTHNAYAQVEALQQPWPISEDIEMCGQTLLENLETEPEGDAYYILAHQVIAAMLNVANGASASDQIEEIIAYSKAMVTSCEVSEKDRDRAILLSELLDAYNNGEVGPGHCE